MPEQTDWIRFEDNLAQVHHLTLASVERLGIPLVARFLRETPSALRNHVAGRRTLPPGTFAICYLLDPVFRRDLAGVCGEVLTKHADLTPEQALREAYATTSAQGFISKSDLADLMARTKRDDESAAPLRAVQP